MNKKTILACHEMRTMRWFYAAGCICALLITVLLYTRLEEMFVEFENPGIGGYYGISLAEYGSTFSSFLRLLLSYGVIGAVLAFAFMSTVQFGELHNRGSREYLASLPFTQGQRFAIKAALGYGAITVSCVVLTVGVLSVRSRFIDAIIKLNIVRYDAAVIFGNETIWHTVRSLALFWLILMAMYSVYMTVQSMVSQGIIAGLVGVGALAAPLELGTVAMFFYRIAQYRAGNMEAIAMVDSQFEHVQRTLGAFFGFGMGVSESISISLNDNEAYRNIVYYENMWILFIGMAVILIGCTLLAYYVSRKQDLAYAGTLVPMKGVRIALSLGVAICFATAVVSPFADTSVNMGIIVLLCLILAAIGFLICRKLLKRVIK